MEKRDALLISIVVAAAVLTLIYAITADRSDYDRVMIVSSIVGSVITLIVIVYACLTMRAQNSPSNVYRERYMRSEDDDE